MEECPVCDGTQDFECMTCGRIGLEKDDVYTTIVTSSQSDDKTSHQGGLPSGGIE